MDKSIVSECYTLSVRVAVVGIGAMGRGIVSIIQKTQGMDVVAISDINKNALKNVNVGNALSSVNPEDVFEVQPDILIDATPSVYEPALLIQKALRRKINVIMMNAEVDQVYGRILAFEAKKNGAIITSHAGDQHGALVRTIDEIHSMGFEVVMAGNNKGFLNRFATPDKLVGEAAKRRLSLKQCTQFTDGTKLAIEMALVANYSDLTILETGMSGPIANNVFEALQLFDLDRAHRVGGVVDYVLGAQPGGSVFAIAYSDDPEDRFYLNYYKMGEGPYYLFLRPYHLCHFDTPYTIQRIMKYKSPVLIQQKRVLEVGARAKTDLKSGTVLDGIGGYHLYGLLEEPKNLPIGLSDGAILLSDKKRDEPIEWEDVEYPVNDKKVELWNKQLKIESY